MSTYKGNKMFRSPINSPVSKKSSNTAFGGGSKTSKDGRSQIMLMDAPNEITIRSETKIEDLIDEETDYEEEEEEEEEEDGDYEASTMDLFLDGGDGSTATGNRTNTNNKTNDNHTLHQNKNSHIFGAFARVFFQGKNDRYATQVLPTNSSVQARDSYLYIEVDTKKKKLSLFPDINEKVLLIKPPIQLKYFYAVKVPQSLGGTALFLKDDDRYYHRYTFRFEFRNDTVRIHPSQFNVFKHYSSFLKKKRKEKKQYFVKKVTFGDSTSIQQEVSEQKLTDACETYMSGTSDLLKNVAIIADLFVRSVNHQPNIKKYIKRSKFWGTGYRSAQVGHGNSDVESSTDDDDDDDDVDDNDFDTASYDSDLSIQTKSKTESIQQSFEKMFGKLEKYVKE